MPNMTKDKKARVLPPEPQILDRIRKVRMQLAGSDREDHVRETEQWEARAKKALIIMSAAGHEGIQIIMEKARQEIRQINWKLVEEREVGFEFTTEMLINDSLEREDLLKMRKLWQWFLQIFGESQEDLNRITQELQVQESGEQEDIEFTQ